MNIFLASSVLVLAALASGCAVHKLPDPSRQNVWMCKRAVVVEKPTCAQVDPSATVPKGSKCKALPQTGGSELVVCQQK